jgi:hypothetical protein
VKRIGSPCIPMSALRMCSLTGSGSLLSFSFPYHDLFLVSLLGNLFKRIAQIFQLKVLCEQLFVPVYRDKVLIERRNRHILCRESEMPLIILVLPSSEELTGGPFVLSSPLGRNGNASTNNFPPGLRAAACAAAHLLVREEKHILFSVLKATFLSIAFNSPM